MRVKNTIRKGSDWSLLREHVVRSTSPQVPPSRQGRVALVPGIVELMLIEITNANRYCNEH